MLFTGMFRSGSSLVQVFFFGLGSALQSKSCFFAPVRPSPGLKNFPGLGFISGPGFIFSGLGMSGPVFPTVFFVYNYICSSYLNLGSMLDRLVLKNAADCISQRVKRTSGARVVIFLLELCFFVVFERLGYARTMSLGKC